MGLTYFIYGASRGVGLALTTQISADPSNTVIGTLRSKSDGLSRLAAERKNVHIITLDIVETPETLETLPEAVKQYTDSIDVIIANGAISSDVIHPDIEVPPKVWLDHYKVNALAPTLIVSKLAPLLKAATTKKIVFISSQAGSLTKKLPNSSSAYGQSKAALNFVAKLLELELKSDGVTVIALHPSVVETDFSAKLRASLKEDDPALPYIDSLAISSAESASGMLHVIDKLELSDSGKFYCYDGTETAFQQMNG